MIAVLKVTIRNIFYEKLRNLTPRLTKKPPQYLEYIIVHELMHLIEPTHNRRFTELMNTHMPKWREFREELNRLAIGKF